MAAYTRVRDRSAGNSCDAALVLRARDGDIVAFDSLYRKYHKLIVCWVREWLRCESWVDEFTDQAIVVLRKELPGYRPDGASFCSWAYRVAKSATIKHARTLGLNRDEVAFDLLGEDALVDPMGPEDAYVAKRVREEVENLDFVQRAALRGPFYDGLSDEELADELHLPVRRVCYRRKQAKSVLRKRLSDVRCMSI
jgi:RNA polymerase sigma-70 factor, ECF subfamily